MGGADGASAMYTFDPAWLTKLDERRAIVMPILERAYGRDGRRWFHRWRLFFMACAELFAYRGGTEWFVSHYRWERG